MALDWRYSLQLYWINFSLRGITLACSAFIFPIKVASNGYLRGYVSFAHFLLYFYFVLIQGPDIRLASTGPLVLWFFRCNRKHTYFFFFCLIINLSNKLTIAFKVNIISTKNALLSQKLFWRHSFPSESDINTCVVITLFMTWHHPLNNSDVIW